MAIAQYFIDHPVAASEFGELGQRVDRLATWIDEWGNRAPPDKSSDQRFDYPTPYTPDNYTVALETLAVTLFPFIRPPGTNKSEPLRLLRKTFNKGPGMVIPTTIESFRYTCHLILNVRTILHSTLPIQIMYHGDEEFPLAYRRALKKMERSDITFIEIRKVLDTTGLGLENAGSAINPFAILASTFSQVVFVDPEVIWLQKPESIFFTHEAQWKTGSLFFHDRLVGKGEFEDRQEWLRHQLRRNVPSETLLQSVAMGEGYGQEATDGVVSIDKGRLRNVMGLVSQLSI